TSAMRASGAAARRILVNAATRSPKNITPKAEINKSYSSSAAVAGSACRQSILVMPAARARLSPSASIGPEMSNPATRPEGPAARANSSVGAPQPQPISTIRSPARGAAKASKASVTGASVMSVCSCRATQISPPFPFQKASMSALISSGAAIRVLPPSGRTLRYCRADRKRRRGDATSVRIARMTNLPVADPRCLLRVKRRRIGPPRHCPLHRQHRSSAAKHLVAAPSVLAPLPGAREQRQREEHARELCQDERRRVRGTNAREGVGERAGDGDGGIGEGRRRREPVRAGGVGADGHGGIARLPAAPHPGARADAPSHPPEPLTRAGPHMRAELPDRELEHEVREPDTQDRAQNLRRDVGGHEPPGETARERRPQSHRGVHVRARGGSEGEDER